MATTAFRPAFPPRSRSLKCSHPHAHLIYDDPHVFQVRSRRARSAHFRPCDACLAEANRQAALAANIQYQQRCSRLPPRPVGSDHFGRPRTAPSNRTPTDCNWENFMKKKSKHAIPTPYVHCDVAGSQAYQEDRPPFLNYGGRCSDKHSGQKRTFNSRAVHQLKHCDADDQRVRSVLRERHLRHQAESYFRENERRQAHE